MTDWPNSQDYLLSGTIHSLGLASSVGDMALTRSSPFTTATAWTTANDAIYIPFLVQAPCTAYQMAIENGATVAGNVDLGIYDVNQVRLVSIGSTAMAGVSTIQTFNITDTVLGPGVYFMAFASDSTTATFVGMPAGTAQWLRSYGVQQQATAFALPATATMATPTRTVVPSLAIATTSVI